MAFSILLLWMMLLTGSACSDRAEQASSPAGALRVHLGPRPFYLLDQLAAGPLRDRLEACRELPVRPTRFSIAHRGAPLQFPEHTADAYRAAARMGSGMIECDVTFTADRQLVCRHAQCDLHTTTNILTTPLAEKCSEGFQPAELDPETGGLIAPAHARCCTSDLTLAEFQRLEARMDAADPRATSVEAYLDATPAWRTDLYARGGPLITHRESIALFHSLGVEMIPELKTPSVEMPFRAPGDDAGPGYTRADFARQLVDEYRQAGIPAERVRLQSFDPDDIRLWLAIAPEFGARAAWLDGRSPSEPIPTQAAFEALHREGFRTLAPPIATLLRLDESGAIRATDYATRARAAGLDLITWTAERSGRIRSGLVESNPREYYLGPIQSELENDGDIYRVIDALVQEVGIIGLFSDWPATTSFYASCLGLD